MAFSWTGRKELAEETKRKQKAQTLLEKVRDDIEHEKVKRFVHALSARSPFSCTMSSHNSSSFVISSHANDILLHFARTQS